MNRHTGAVQVGHLFEWDMPSWMLGRMTRGWRLEWLVHFLTCNDILCSPLSEMVPGMPRPIAPFALQPADVLTLQGWLGMSTLEQSLAQRARILLLLNEGVTPIAICGQLQMTTPTVFKCIRSMNPTFRQMGLRFTVAFPASSSTAAAPRSPLPTRHAATAPVRGAATYRAPGRWPSRSRPGCRSAHWQSHLWACH